MIRTECATCVINLQGLSMVFLRKSFILLLMILIAISVNPLLALSQASGPDFLSVTRVDPGSFLSLRAAPSQTAGRIARIPHDARYLRNLGCQIPGASAETPPLSPSGQEEVAKRIWCRIEFEKQIGWAAGWFLTEDRRDSAQSEQGTQLMRTQMLRASPEENRQHLYNWTWILTATPQGKALGDAWIKFNKSGLLIGKLGCNIFKGHFSMQGKREINFLDFRKTDLSCDADIYPQEVALSLLLSGRTEYAVQGTNFLLRKTGNNSTIHVFQFLPGI